MIFTLYQNQAKSFKYVYPNNEILKFNICFDGKKKWFLDMYNLEKHVFKYYLFCRSYWELYKP